jgi:tRNA threonylcarbamoyl adenosine modification protein YeaZ
MKILALELSAGIRSVAAVDSEAGCLAAVKEEHARHTRLFFMVQQALDAAGWSRETVEGLAVGLGPGSYTGIRMAIAAAQGWYATRPVKLWGINSFHVMAEGLWRSGQRGEIFLAVDAQRGEACWAGYQINDAGWQETQPLQLLPQSMVREHSQNGRRIWGPDLQPWCPAATDWHPRAEDLARLAAAAAPLADASALTPLYIREARFAKAPPPRMITDL